MSDAREPRATVLKLLIALLVVGYFTLFVWTGLAVVLVAVSIYLLIRIKKVSDRL